MTDEQLEEWIVDGLPGFQVKRRERVKWGDRVWWLRDPDRPEEVRVEITDHLIVKGPLEQRLKEAEGWLPKIQSGEIRGVRITKKQGVLEWSPNP